MIVEGLRPPVTSKMQNWQLVSSGVYGNKLRHWRSWAEVQASGFPGPISIRGLESCWLCRYDLSLTAAEAHVQQLLAAGFAAESLCFNEGAPDKAILVQGELLNGVPYHARVSHEKAKMREALRRAYCDVTGWRALETFRAAMTPSSREDLEVLLQWYPEHVFEISVYDRCLGDVPGRNALVWEIRLY